MRRASLLMFVFSGMAGLVFEVALQRSLTRIFGVSALATSTVLAAWMAGLALGAVAFGRLVDRARHPLRLYALLELGIAGCAVVMPWVVSLALSFYASLASGRTLDDVTLRVGVLALAFVITLVPTMLMGGTLPAVARALSGTDDISALYTANIFGAALGAALGSYLVLPALGLTGAMWLGGTFNLIAAGLGWWLSRVMAVPARAAVEQVQRAPVRWWALAFWSGAATFIAEVTWFHLLGAVIGTSAYAFGLMLALFLMALTVGAAVSTRRPATEAMLGQVQALAALSLVLTLPLWDRASALFVMAGAFVSSFEGREAVRALVAAQLIVIPAAVLGAVFPLALRLGARTRTVGRAIGGLAAANTLGAIVGSLATGYVLLPLLGSRGTLLTLVFGCGALGLALSGPRYRVLASVAVVLALVFPRWNMASLASGSNVYFAETPYFHSQVEWARESVSSGITTVVRHPTSQKLTLLTNGKFQGNESGEVEAQRAFAQVPLVAIRNFGRALLIGVGTGCSLGALAAQPFEHLDAAELSQDILDAARLHFGSVNEGVLEPQPRVSLHVADGRNHLLLTKHRYDFVTLQLSSIWFAGAADLYNREFYALLKQRLNPGAVVQQWVQLHHMTRHDLAVIVATLKSEFPHVLLFFRGNQGLLIATQEPLEFDLHEFDRRTALLRGTAATRGLPADDLLSLTGHVLLDEAGIDRLIAEERPRLSTDDNLLLEFSTPRANADDSLLQAALVDSLEPLRPTQFPLRGIQSDDDRLRVQLAFLIGRGELEAARALLPAQPSPALVRWAEWLNVR